MLIAAIFLIAMAPAITPPLRSVEQLDGAMIETWSADQVRRWAVENAPKAAMLDAERQALGQGLGPHDTKRRAQVGLSQAVLREIAAQDRNESAGEALTVYYRIVGLQSQADLLRQADAELAELIPLAERAEAFDLPDADSNALRQRQVSIQDQLVQAEFGQKKLRQRLASLTGQGEAIAMTAVLSSPLELETTAMHPDAAVAEALASRGDMRAVRTLCRCTNEDTLPAARRLMGILQPGLGLALPASKHGFIKTLLSKLLHWEHPPEDLAWRRHQCRSLERFIADSIRDQVIQAQMDLDQSIARRELGDETAKLASDASIAKSKAVELGQAPIGSDRIEMLASIKADGEATQRRIDVTLAEVAFRQARGILAQ